jgi:signal transduction histidine kinase/DNA-binding NarL/FixJ family response regulator
LGKTDTELEVGVKEGEYVADITPVLADGQAFINQDERLLDADGNWIYNSASAVPLRDSNGNITGLVGISRDVTELKRAEADLKEAAEAAEAANRSKSAFLANMSHEIRTPMNAILGFSQLMLRDPYLSPSQSEHLEVINRSGEHLLALINDILELSKIEAGRLTFTPSTFDLHKLLDDMEMMFRVRTDDKRLSLIMERIGSVPHWVISDEGKLRQVLINLMGNAVKFTEEGGVGVRVGVQADESGKNRLLFEVEDTGPGIPEEEIENLFIVFEQGSSGVKMGGTGLGLALSKGFIQIMGGTISVASTAGKGSIFEFTIPFEEGKEEQVEQKRVHKRVIGVKPGQDERRVLIADDRETNRRLLAKMLAMDGFKLREVTNGAEVLAAFHEWKPDIILMDMTMPVMDGYTATRTIKATEEGKDTLIIAITASAFQEDKQRVMEAGADGYLSKPFKEAELFEIIHQKNGIVFLYDEHAEKDQESHVENDAQWQAAIAELPADLVRACRDAAENADILWLVDLFNDISIYNPAVAQKLNELASRYAYEEITYLLRLGE